MRYSSGFGVPVLMSHTEKKMQLLSESTYKQSRKMYNTEKERNFKIQST